MPVSDIVDVQIVADIVTVSRAGFGVPMLLGYTTVFPERVKLYSDVADMVADGFGSGDPLVLMAEALVRQNPRVPNWKIGRVDIPATSTGYIIEVQPITIGVPVSVTVWGPGATVGVLCTHTPVTGEDASDVATSISAQMNAIVDVSTGTTGASIDAVGGNVGDLLYFTAPLGVTVLSDSGSIDYAGAIDAIRLIDDDWYAVAISDPGPIPSLDAFVAKVESLKKISAVDFLTDGPGGFTAWAASHTSENRTAALVSGNEKARAYPAIAWLGQMLPRDPGSATWAYKTLAGAEPTAWSTSAAAAILAASGNTYERIGGVNITRNGWSMSGRFLDITRSADWLEARITERVFSLIVRNEKLPYTDASVDLVLAEIRAALGIAIDRDVVRAEPPPVVTAPKVADVDPVDRANRLLPDVRFTGEFAGAIHKVKIRGTLSV